jgi:hypothetical protein
MSFSSESVSLAFTKYKNVKVTSSATASSSTLEDSKILSQDVANSIAQNNANIIDQTIEILNKPLDFTQIDKLLTNSCYIVPLNNFIAYFVKINPDTKEITKIPVKDQTIWLIKTCNNGNVIGEAYTITLTENTNEILGSAFSYFFGSISKNGFINFYFTKGNGSLQDKSLMITLGQLNYINFSNIVFDMQLSAPYYNTKIFDFIGFMHSSYMVEQNINEPLPKEYYFKNVNEFTTYVINNNP